jgi:hypothetical protein
MQRRVKQRCATAIAVGLAAGLFTYAHLVLVDRASLGYDFTWPWRAARVLLGHRDPYTTIVPTGQFPFDNYFKYPLPAAILAVPLAGMSAAAAAATFGGVSAALLAWGLTTDGWHRLWILASAPFAITLESGQWSTLLMAGTLLAPISWVAVCKPTVGLAVFAYRPNWWAVLGSTILLIASFLVLPSWVAGWIQSVRADPTHKYVSVVTLTGGPLVLLALLRWRQPEARYLVVLALVPQILTFYTAFLPMLVAQTKRESQAMAALGSLAWLCWTWQVGSGSEERFAPVLAGYWILSLLFVPALILVLRRRNGATPASTAVTRAIKGPSDTLRDAGKL